MRHSAAIQDSEVLFFLKDTKRPASRDEIASALRISPRDRRSLEKLLDNLKRRGAIEELSGSRYRLADHPSPGAGAHAQGGPMVRRPPQQPKPEQAGPRNLLPGRLVLHRDGYGFVVPDTPLPNLDGDIFVGREHIGDAMHGDRVLAQITRVSGAPGARRAEGRIVRITGRHHPAIVGLFRYGPRGNVVLPYDTRVQHEIAIPPGEELSPALREKLGLSADVPHAPHAKLPRLPVLDGAVVNAEIVRYPRGGAGPTGRVVEILGRPGDLGVDTEIIIRKHHLPYVFAPEVLEEAEQRAHPVSTAAIQGRADFRHLPIVTIDGETARDFDDAVYVERRPDGGWHLAVHIADVAHYVGAGAALDREARLRGTSVYFPDRAVPMLPEALSNGICSLNPREDRLVMSALMEFDGSGRMREAHFTPGVIRSVERMTYTNVNKVLEGDAEMCERYAPLVTRFREMKDLALLLNARRNEHGSIDFDLPEPVIEFDAEQRMTNILRSERNIAHRLIEEFMLAANRAVASYLLERGLPALHRVHEKPDAKKILEFEELARAFGYSLGVEDLVERVLTVRHGKTPAPTRQGRPESPGHGRDRPQRVILPGAGELRITPQHYQKLLRKLAGKPEERIVSYLMLRSLKQARYSAESLGHFALGFDAYTHFTSPIRRYPDLIVHRILKWALAHPQARAPGEREIPRAHPGAEAVLYARMPLEEMAAETSEAERGADSAERELMDWKTAQFMEEHLGEEYDALIISVQKYGCFVELFDVFVEGLLPIAALEEAADARCIYRERDHAITAVQPGGRSAPRASRRGVKPAASTWRLGDRVRVRAERIDPMRHRVEFALVERK